MQTGKFVFFFLLLWSGMTLLFDGFTVVPTVRQAMARRFPSTEGTVLASEVTEHDSDDGMTYGVSIRYRYTVGSREYEGSRYRYQSVLTSGHQWADAVVKAHPPESTIKVFYNPASPRDALISPGVSGEDLFLLVFMTPFNAVMLGFWSAGLAHLRLRWFKPVAGGARVISNLRRTKVRLTPFSPLAAALAGAGLAAFVSIFVVGATKGFHPPIHTMLVTWSVIGACGVLSGISCGFNIFSGKYDLIIDDLAGVLELPATRGRNERARIPFSSIESVYVETVQKSNGDGEGSSFTYVPMLGIKEGSVTRFEGLVEWYSSPKARAFVEWLKEQLPVKDLNLARDREGS